MGAGEAPPHSSQRPGCQKPRETHVDKTKVDGQPAGQFSLFKTTSQRERTDLLLFWERPAHCRQTPPNPLPTLRPPSAGFAPRQESGFAIAANICRSGVGRGWRVVSKLVSRFPNVLLATSSAASRACLCRCSSCGFVMGQPWGRHVRDLRWALGAPSSPRRLLFSSSATSPPCLRRSLRKVRILRPSSTVRPLASPLGGFPPPLPQVKAGPVFLLPADTFGALGHEAGACKPQVKREHSDPGPSLQEI